jgi:Tol biopolymer transport system component
MKSFLRVVLIIVGCASLCIVGAQRIGATSEGYTCLTFSDGRNVPWMVDLASGFHAIDRRDKGDTRYRTAATSPDGKFAAYLDYPAPGTLGNTLFVRRTDSPDSPPIPVQVDISGGFNFAWVGAEMFYGYMGKNSYYSLARYNPETGERKSFTFTTQNLFTMDFYGYSPINGGIFALGIWNSSTQRRSVSFWDFNTLQPVERSRSWNWVTNEMWSPDGEWIAYLASDNRENYVVLFSLRGEYQFRIPNTLNTPALEWSPDSRFLSAQYFDQYHDPLPYWQLDVFGVDGNARINIAHSTDTISPGAYWSSDGGSLFYLGEGLGGRDLRQYVLDDPENVITLVPFATNTPIRSLGGTYAAVVSRRGVMYTAHVLKDAESHVIFTDADDMGDPVFYGERYVAVTWAREDRQAGARRVGIAWADLQNTDESPPRMMTIDAGYTDVRDLRNVGDTVVFVAANGDGYSIEAVDLQTGEVQTIVTGYDWIDTPNVSSDGVTFWLRDGEFVGYETRTLDGALIARYDLSADAQLRAEMSPGSRNLIAFNKKVFIAPDGTRAALKIRTADAEMLQIALPDGSTPITVSDNLSGLGDPLWSPDGSLLTFTQAVRESPLTANLVTLEIVDLSGRTVRKLDALHGFFNGVTWTRCDDENE